MVQLVLDLEVVTLNLVFDESRDLFVPRSTWEGTTWEMDSFDATLDVNLYQLRPRRRRCVGTIQVPLTSLPVQKEPTTHISVPCDEGTLDLDLFVESEYLEWTRSELEARRKASSFFWPSASSSSPPPKSPPSLVEVTDDDEDVDDGWGWILCYAC